MPTILEAVTQAVTPQQTKQFAETLGLDETEVKQGLDKAAPLALAALGNQVATPEGADEVLGSLKQVKSNSMDAVTDGTSDTLLSQWFGIGLDKVTGWIQDTTGVNVAPFLPLVAPFVANALEQAISSQNLDGAGLTNLLNTENEAYARTNPQFASEIKVALDTGENVNERADEIRARFTEEEWNTLTNVPSMASYAVMVSDWSSPGGIEKEMNALLQVLSETALHDDPDTLIGLISRNVTSPDSLGALGIHRDNAMPMTRDASLDALAILNDKATHEETLAFKKFVMDAATRVAQATNDGGILGIGGKPISDTEQMALNFIAAALAYQP